MGKNAASKRLIIEDSDEMLLEKAKSDQEALQKLTERYRPKLESILKSRFNNSYLVPSLFQETFRTFKSDIASGTLTGDIGHYLLSKTEDVEKKVTEGKKKLVLPIFVCLIFIPLIVIASSYFQKLFSGRTQSLTYSVIKKEGKASILMDHVLTSKNPKRISFNRESVLQTYQGSIQLKIEEGPLVYISNNSLIKIHPRKSMSKGGYLLPIDFDKGSIFIAHEGNSIQKIMVQTPSFTVLSKEPLLELKMKKPVPHNQERVWIGQIAGESEISNKRVGKILAKITPYQIFEGTNAGKYQIKDMDLSNWLSMNRTRRNSKSPLLIRNEQIKNGVLGVKLSNYLSSFGTICSNSSAYVLGDIEKDSSRRKAMVIEYGTYFPNSLAGMFLKLRRMYIEQPFVFQMEVMGSSNENQPSIKIEFKLDGRIKHTYTYNGLKPIWTNLQVPLNKLTGSYLDEITLIFINPADIRSKENKISLRGLDFNSLKI